MEWLKNLSKAIEYIEKNLAGEISYEEAAKIACCSTYYFQRMFSYVAGIPLSEYIRRRRMTQAAFELQTTDSKVLEVALKYGYTSPTSFNRAFQSVHGISPISAKAQGSVLNAYPPIRFSVKIMGGNVMPYRVEEKEAMRIVGIRIPLAEGQLKTVFTGIIDIMEHVLPLGSVVDLKKDFLKNVIGNTDKVENFRVVITDRFFYQKGDRLYFPYAGVLYPIGAFQKQERLNFTSAVI